MNGTAIDDFKKRLDESWLTPFCQPRGLDPEGFVKASVDKLSEWVASRQVVYRLAPSGDCYADFFIASMMRLVSLGSTSFTGGTSKVM